MRKQGRKPFPDGTKQLVAAPMCVLALMLQYSCVQLIPICDAGLDCWAIGPYDHAWVLLGVGDSGPFNEGLGSTSQQSNTGTLMCACTFTNMLLQLTLSGQGALRSVALTCYVGHVVTPAAYA